MSRLRAVAPGATPAFAPRASAFWKPRRLIIPLAGPTSSPEAVLDAAPPPRVAPPDCALPQVAADDPAGAELDASVRVVHELALVQTIHLRGAHVQAGLRLARAADVRGDDDERLLVRLELVEREARSEEHTSELQSRFDLVCRLLLEKKKKKK